MVSSFLFNLLGSKQEAWYMDMNGINNNLAITNGLPLGLAFGMAMNEQAMEHYGKLTEYEKEKLIAESKNVRSKEEMNQLIQRLGDGMY